MAFERNAFNFFNLDMYKILYKFFVQFFTIQIRYHYYHYYYDIVKSEVIKIHITKNTLQDFSKC